jgi:hypothetical protein
VPDSRRMPLPPVPQIPQAPQLNNKLYQNAFTPNVPPDAQQATPQGYLPPAGPQMTGGQAMSPGYGPGMPPGGMMPAYPPGIAPARYPMPGYGPMPTSGYGQPGQGVYPPYAQPGYGMPPGMNGYPNPAMGMPMQPPGRGTVPYAYQGPLPPNPFAAAPAPSGSSPGYGQAPVAPNWPAGQPRNVAMDRPAVPAGVSAGQASANGAIQEMVTVLKTATYPSQREWAANNLATFDWRGNPQVVQALVTAAREDPAATVRAGCAYNLGRMRVATEPVLATLEQLKTDRDPRVRSDAEHALARLSAVERPGVNAAARNPVQPVRATQGKGQ